MSKTHQYVNYTLLSTSNSTEFDSSCELMKQFENEQEIEVSGDVNLFVAESDSYLSTSAVEMRHHTKSNVLNENIGTVAHILTVQFVIFILYLSFSHEVVLFTWHPILLSLGWSLFMTEAILTISGDNLFAKFISTRNKVFVHWVLQICTSCCILSGFIIVYVNKNLHNKEHFTTWHGILGLVSIIFFIPTCIIGVLTLYKVDLRQYISIKLNRVVHIFFGVVTFILGSVTVLLSLNSNWFVKKTNYTAQVLCFIAILVTTLCILVKPFKFLSRNLSH